MIFCFRDSILRAERQFFEKMLAFQTIEAYNICAKEITTCRCDGIGRRSGLKIHRWRQRAGSSPATGTKIRGIPEGVPRIFRNGPDSKGLIGTKQGRNDSFRCKANMPAACSPYFHPNLTPSRPPAPKSAVSQKGCRGFFVTVRTRRVKSAQSKAGTMAFAANCQKACNRQNQKILLGHSAVCMI